VRTLNRILSGIPGFDSLVGGGIPENDIVLLSGTCGAGKTIFGMQFIISNIQKEPGIFVSFEDEIPQLRAMAASFGWDTARPEKAGRLKFLKYDPFKIEDIFELVESNIRDLRAKRIVVDSVSSLGLYVKDPPEFRRMLLQISNMLRKNKCTSILISEVPPGTNRLSRFGMEEFVSDGVVVMHNILMANEYRRGISIWKMRSTDHSRRIHPYRITGKGIVVYPDDRIILHTR
jgi:KaiC/GvpD/RAD55 family RecA-like ATPase